ncbi:MAG: pantoate--beta-alanine ligase [Nitrospiraceae bacterium]|nr:pantoate--beta-alanine ligase [Nitrospiraceae bacterium]
MNIIRTVRSMTAWSDRLRREGVTIGFVPTMGALHDGHRSLIRAARLRCDALVVSIFVNPTQFSPTEDLSAYPRPIARDRALCLEEGVDVCFEPTARTMYPEGFQTTVAVPALARRWEGEARPHHFTGVATVVTKLFGIVQPHLALFGQKDYQQAALVKRLVADLNLGVTIDVRSTIREQDGLAMSSRNRYLSPEDRRAATILYQALQAGRQTIEAGREAASTVEHIMRQTIEQEPTVHIEYLALCDPASLEPLERVDRRTLLLGAIRIGSVRLIDNVVVTASDLMQHSRIAPVTRGR